MLLLYHFMLTASLTTPWSSLFFGRSSLRPCIKVWRGGRGGWVGGYEKHTRSTAADQPALLPDYNIIWGGGGWGGHDKHTAHHTRSTAADASFTPEAFTGPTFGSRTMGHHFVLALCVAYVLLMFCCCVSRVHPAPLLTRGSRHFGRVIRSCWTLTLKFSLVVRLILSRILRHLLVRYLLEALCPGVGYLLHCRVFALPDALARPLPAYPGFALRKKRGRQPQETRVCWPAARSAAVLRRFGPFLSKPW